MKRQFASLTPQEALHVAIFIEERNAELYEQFSDLFSGFKDPDSLEIAKAFTEMAEEERSHGTILQDRYFELYGTQACVITEEEIRDMIELPRLENSDIFSVSRGQTSLLPRRAALQVALEAENSAMRYYVLLAETTADPDLRSLYRELAVFESDHTNLIEQKLAAAERSLGEGRA